MEEWKLALYVDTGSLHPGPNNLLLLLVYVTSFKELLQTRYNEGNIEQSRISMEGATEMPLSHRLD